MSRFLLDDATFERIAKELPSLEDLATAIMNLSPDFISINYPAESNVPVAAICLRDTLDALIQVRMGLSECLQHKIWYREKCNPPNEEHAVLYMRFYIDALVSQLYAAGEHLANAIIFMLDLSENQIKTYRKNRVSQQSVLGHYLAKEQTDSPLTKAILVLVASEQWKKTMTYRKSLVHEQPPTVSSLVPVYRRRKRWIQSTDRKSFNLGLGIGDEAEYSIDEILGFVQPATFQLVELFGKVFDGYLKILSKKGITLTKEGLQVKIF